MTARLENHRAQGDLLGAALVSNPRTKRGDPMAKAKRLPMAKAKRLLREGRLKTLTAGIKVPKKKRTRSPK